jgi:hypothetical protein
MLTLSRFAAVQTDKDGGYCLIHKEVLYGMHRAILDGDNYVRCQIAVDSVVRDLTEEYVAMVNSMPGLSEDVT